MTQTLLRACLSTADLLALGPTTDVETAGSALGIGRTTAYALAKADDFPCEVIRVGRAYRVLTASLLRVLGIEQTQTGDGAEGATSAPSIESTPTPTSGN